MRTDLEYTSSFRPRKSLSAGPAGTVVPQIAYEEHEFQKVTIATDESGNLEEVVSLDEKIEISRDWRLHCDGAGPADGYISKGLSKYAFMVCGMVSVRYAFY